MDSSTPQPQKPEDPGQELVTGLAGQIISIKAQLLGRRLRLGPADLEDIEQELRLEVFQRSPRFDPVRGTWEAFVHCVVNSRSRSLFRRLHRKRRPILLSMTERRSDGALGLTTDDSGSRDATDLRHDLQQVRTRLTAEERELFDLLADHSVTQIAAVLKMPRTTVSSRIRLLDERLRPLWSWVGKPPGLSPDGKNEHKSSSRRKERG